MIKNINKKGFTLVELMIVITVIAILAAIAVVSFTRVQKQARDTKRKAELKSMQTALQAYFTEKNQYPIQTTEAPALTALTGLSPTYMSSVPKAPFGSTGNYLEYTYSTDATGFKYALCVDLEAASSSGSAILWKVDTSNSAGAEIADTGTNICTPQ